ncbi:MAG TPA: thioredoxin family protein [Dehalococcoidia bacterium]|nr:thioredoxin family protein [Dehalococcoidia bacterium]
MTRPSTSVVTPERYAQGLTWEQWMQAIEKNQARFQENYDETALPSEDVEAIRALVARPDGPARCLAIGEDWCPDVFRGLPVMAKLAHATGMELRIFFRDRNKDIMAEFLNRGEFESIPVFVFYTRDLRYIAHWIERPQKANDEMHLLRAIFEGRSREEARDEYIAFQRGPVWAGWRLETVREIRALLEGQYRD